VPASDTAEAEAGRVIHAGNIDHAPCRVPLPPEDRKPRFFVKARACSRPA